MSVRAVLCGLVIAGCGVTGESAEPTAAAEVRSPRECRAAGSLADFESALVGETAPPVSGGVHPLARADEELAYLEVALDELGGGGELGEALRELRSALRRHRDDLASQLSETAASHREARAVLREAAVCGGFDFRTHGAAGIPKRCRDAGRLWAAVRAVDLTSPVSTRSVAHHVRELSLDGERVVERLLAHAKNLQRLDRAIDVHAGHDDAALHALAIQRIDAADRIQRRQIRCLERLRPTARVVSEAAEPRDATVVVRPRWPRAVEAASRMRGTFGSGFVVRWRAANGAVETRIVTNHHVLDGAVEAEIFPSDSADDENPIVAHVVQSIPRDDIAILRVEESSRSRTLHGAGIRFRLDPAREQEKVSAAGFPGVSGSPSYQITQGVVSNARFNAEEHDPQGVAAFIQHTAPIDPGNSGGPLLDGRGRLLGMNALKIFGRENVGLAIPTARIQLAMLRADDRPRRTVRHAAAACNMAVAALASASPQIEETFRFGLPLHASFDASSRTATASHHRQRVVGQPLNALETARTRLYAGVKASLDAEGGVELYAACTDVHETDGRFTATFATATASHDVVLADEGGTLRLVDITTAAGPTPAQSDRAG